MEKIMPYRNLDHALRCFRGQVSVGIPWAIEEVPELNSPQACFNWLKTRTRYKKDPKGTELFQKIQTLLTEDNYHGIVGAGDCDCFTIAALSTLIANRFTDCGIVLAGRKVVFPVHIWAWVEHEGKYYDFDLTNPRFDQVRDYKFTQKIPYRLNQEEKNMLLQLADGPAPSVARPSYVWMPSKGVYVREDHFDNMSAGQFQSMCLEEGLEVEVIEELSGKRAERRMERKNQTLEYKTKKKASKPRNVRKMIKAESKAEVRYGRADKNRDTGRARVEKAQRKQYMTGAERSATVGSIVKGASDITGSVFTRPQPDYQGIPSEFTTMPEQDQDNVEVVPEDQVEVVEPEGEMSEGNKKLLWGLGLTAVIIAGTVIYIRAQKKRRRRMRSAA